MAIRRYNAKRDANEGIIIAALEAMGCLVYRMDTPVDLLVYNVRSGAILLVEVKTKRGTLTKDQRTFAEYWPIHVVRTPDEAIALVQNVRRAA